MAKIVHNSVLDAMLSFLQTEAILCTVCDTQPTSYAEATAGAYVLADVALTGTDFTIADDTSGRKVTIQAKSTVTIDASGDATHVALCSDDTLLYVTTCTTTSLTSGNTVNLGAWKISISDPA